MKKNQSEKLLRWKDVPSALSLIESKDNVVLNNLYAYLVLRLPVIQPVNYTCEFKGCGYNWTIKKYEELPECPHCGRFAGKCAVHLKNIKYNPPMFMTLVKEASIQLGNLYSHYTQKSFVPFPIDKVGFADEGYYLKFQDGEFAYSRDIKETVVKAALYNKFVWDFNFPWEKYNLPGISVAILAEILYNNY